MIYTLLDIDLNYKSIWSLARQSLADRFEALEYPNNIAFYFCYILQLHNKRHSNFFNTMNGFLKFFFLKKKILPSGRILILMISYWPTVCAVSSVHISVPKDSSTSQMSTILFWNSLLFPKNSMNMLSYKPHLYVSMVKILLYSNCYVFFLRDVQD